MTIEERLCVQSADQKLSKAKLLEIEIRTSQAQLAMLEGQSNKKATERERAYLSRLVARKQNERDAIRKTINHLPDSVEKNILVMRYLEYASWETIAQVIGYSDPRAARRAGRRALLYVKIDE